jgi:hypothetical protein
MQLNDYALVTISCPDCGESVFEFAHQLVTDPQLICVPCSRVFAVDLQSHLAPLSNSTSGDSNVGDSAP